MDWEVYPTGLYDLLKRIHDDYQPKEMYITENGAAYSEGPDADGRVRDHRRTSYIHGHLLAVKRAIADGVPVGGYFVWSFLDNFEWSFGYTNDLELSMSIMKLKNDIPKTVLIGFNQSCPTPTNYSWIKDAYDHRPPRHAAAPQPNVELISEPGKRFLKIDGKPTLIKGMNWGWMPIGHNYSFSLWDQPEDVIIEALNRDMTLLKEMGINAIRQTDGIPPKWVEYIYDRWGIMTSVNHYLGRYGMLVDGRWESPTNYENPNTRRAILDQVRAMGERYKDTRGIVFFMLGNENNYGLHWASYEIEALPEGKRNVARAKHLYSLVGEAASLLKKSRLIS